MKIFTLKALLISTAILSTTVASACTDLVINKNQYVASARTLDFDREIDSHLLFFMPGAKNTTDLVIDVDKVDSKKLHSWTNKYGFVGMAPYRVSTQLYDGMNSAGFSVGMLYHSGSAKYASYNPKDNRPVMSALDISNFLLGTMSSVDEAIDALSKLQIVKGAMKIPMGDGLFVQHPVHFIIHDKDGKTAVIEFIDEKVVITRNTVNVMTNSPNYEWHLQNIKKFDNMNPDFKSKDGAAAHSNGAELMGLPGDYSPPSRFAKAAVLVRLTPAPVSLADSVSRARSILDSIAVPRGSSEATTLVKIVRDHVDTKYYFQKVGDYYSYLDNSELYTYDLTRGMNVIDLKSINWNHKFDKPLAIQPTDPKNVKKVIVVQ